jgi:hypothetical protein
MSGSTQLSALVRSCSSSNFLNRTMVAAFHRQIVLKYNKLIKNIKMEPHGTFPLPKSQLTRSSASEGLRQLCWQRRGVSRSNSVKFRRPL